MGRLSRITLDRGMAFNCPYCGAAIGHLCISKRGKEMGRWIHPERTPEPQGAWAEYRLREWLKANADIFTEAA